jgi:hypothetical protein
LGLLKEPNMIYPVSICYTEKPGVLSVAETEDIIYEVEFVSDTPITQDTIEVGTLVPIKGVPVPRRAEYIFAQTVTLHTERPLQTYNELGDFKMYVEAGRYIERITVTGPLVRNKVEAMAKGYYGRLK